MPYHHPEPTLDLSIIVPIYNERDNIVPLAEDIVRAVEPLGLAYEILLVNDGSADGSTAVLDEIADRLAPVKVLHFAGNRGQTIAIAAGLYHSRGRQLITMDGDRQNDPADIGALLRRLNEGFACVSGWRQDRQDSGVRRLPSRIANRLIQRVTGVPVHDLGCTLKAYTRDALDPTELFGEMHRFLAVYVQARGGRIAEMVVRHHPRTAGVSKYGLNRTARVLADLLLIRILHKYRTRPSHMFAKLAQYLFIGAAGFGLVGLLAIVLRWSLAAGSTCLLAALVLGTAAVLVIAVGLVGELVIRAQYALSGRHPWDIARIAGASVPAANAGAPGPAGADPVTPAGRSSD